jgi:membrane-bound metal-dependent hydrolase YbcI (DUF457 family)
LVEIAGTALGGAIGARLPDVLEPALSPHHRALAHSWLAAGGLFFLARAGWAAHCREQANACRERGVSLWRSVEDRQRDRTEELVWRFIAGLIMGFIAGYGSHLALDSATSRGLPLLGLT